MNDNFDLAIACGGKVLYTHRSVVCRASIKLRDLCSDGVHDIKAPIVEDRYNATTVKRMLEFINKGDYSTTTENDEDSFHSDPKLVVLAHLSCHAIANTYQVAKLGEIALKNASAALDCLTPEDFTLIVRIVMESTDTEAIHRVLQTTATKKINDLILCDDFVELLACKHLSDIAALDDVEATKAALKTVTKLAAFSAVVLCTGILLHREEKHEMEEEYNVILHVNDNLIHQAERDKVALLKSKETHNDAFEAIQEAARRATYAESKLQEARSRSTQDEQKALKASQMSRVKAVLANNELSEVRKSGEKSSRGQMVSDTTNMKSGVSVAAAHDQPSKKQTSEMDHAKSLEDSELKEARARITKLLTDKKKLQTSLEQSQGNNEALSRRNATLEKTNSRLCSTIENRDRASNRSAVDRARRRQYIIRRICNLANVANMCISCDAPFGAKLTWDEQHFDSKEEEPEVTVKCKNCNQTHRLNMYLDYSNDSM